MFKSKPIKERERDQHKHRREQRTDGEHQMFHLDTSTTNSHSSPTTTMVNLSRNLRELVAAKGFEAWLLNELLLRGATWMAEGGNYERNEVTYTNMCVPIVWPAWRFSGTYPDETFFNLTLLSCPSSVRLPSFSFICSFLITFLSLSLSHVNRTPTNKN